MLLRRTCLHGFFWHGSNGLLRRAKILGGSNTKKSVFVNAYVQDKPDPSPIAVHRVLGWTFRCPLELADLRWDKSYDVHHINERHTDNALSNLKCWVAKGPGGHRAHSGRQGAEARMRTLRARRAAAEEEEEEADGEALET